MQVSKQSDRHLLLNCRAPYVIQLLIIVGIAFSTGCSDKTSLLQEPDLSGYQVQSKDLVLSILADSATADGVSYDVIQLTAGPSVTGRYSTVSFSVAPQGLFGNDSTTEQKPVDGDGHAQVFVASRFSGLTTVSVEVGGVTQSTDLIFTTAWPDQVSINPDSTFLSPLPGVFTPISVKLGRKIGKPSGGLLLSFEDSTAKDGSHIGVFLNTTLSDTTGSASTQYWLQDTSYHGFLFFRGAVQMSPSAVSGQGGVQVR